MSLRVSACLHSPMRYPRPCNISCHPAPSWQTSTGYHSATPHPAGFSAGSAPFPLSYSTALTPLYYIEARTTLFCWDSRSLLQGTSTLPLCCKTTWICSFTRQSTLPIRSSACWRAKPISICPRGSTLLLQRRWSPRLRPRQYYREAVWKPTSA